MARRKCCREGAATPLGGVYHLKSNAAEFYGEDAYKMPMLCGLSWAQVFDLNLNYGHYWTTTTSKKVSCPGCIEAVVGPKQG